LGKGVGKGGKGKGKVKEGEKGDRKKRGVEVKPPEQKFELRPWITG